LVEFEKVSGGDWFDPEGGSDKVSEDRDGNLSIGEEIRPGMEKEMPEETRRRS